ncbi:MAG: hypothetical protein IT455_00810 [Planctomycetes bacterium]|nr:hypothetical protein [Planctomycetota bacterium]
MIPSQALRHVSSSFGSLFVVSLMAAFAGAQCAPAFVPGASTMGFANGSSSGAPYVASFEVWDPDGPGPSPSVHVFGGAFDFAGSLASRALVVQDPATGAWSSLGVVAGTVYSTLPQANGDLLVRGGFTTVGGVATSSLARLRNGVWSGFPAIAGASSVSDCVQLANGDVVVACDHPSRVLRWDGLGWSPLGGGTNGATWAIEVRGNGDVVVGGDFTQAGGVAATNIARWNGLTWSAMPGLPVSVYGVRALAIAANDDVIAVVDGFVYRFDGVAWSAIGAGTVGVAGTIDSVRTLANGELLGIVHHTTAGRVVRFDGTVWSPVGATIGGLVTAGRSIAGDYVAVGLFKQIAGVEVASAARWDGVGWRPLFAGSDGTVMALDADANGVIVAGGDFQSLAGVACNRIARFDGATWNALGGGIDGPVEVVLACRNGDVVAAGPFFTASGISTQRIAQWRAGAGSVRTWQTMAGGVNGAVRALIELPNGDVVATGEFTMAGGVPVPRIARWNGTVWSPLGAGLDLAGTRLLLDADGSLIVGGMFTSAGGVPANNIARWDGSSWSSLGAGVPGVVGAMARMGDGTLAVLLASSTSPTNLLLWNGGAWSQGTLWSTTLPDVMVALPGGSLLVPTNAQGNPVMNLVKWQNGSTQAMFSGPAAGIRAMALAANGDIVLGGSFDAIGGTLSARFARLRPTCPATVVEVGIGCAGAAGMPALVAAAPPWTGEPFALHAEQLASDAVAIAVTGFTPQLLSLGAIFPFADPSCLLLATPDAMRLLAPIAGAVDWSIGIPASVSLVGTTLHNQVVVAEFDAGGLTQLSASAGVLGTVGIYW